MIECPGLEGAAASEIVMQQTLHPQTWKHVLSWIHEHVPSPEVPAVSLWLKSITLLDIQGDEVRLSTPNPFIADQVKTRCLPWLRQAFEEVTCRTSMKIQFVVTPDPQTARQSVAASVATPAERQTLYERYTFQNFVVGASNQFAAAACRKVSEMPGQVYNPLFIYAGVGLGKTHLLGAVLNHTLVNRPDFKAVYLSAERFTNDVVQSIRHDRMPHLRSRYRNIDMLLMDDVQFLSGKECTQEEFFHTFNTLYEAKKQIVITSDRPAKEIADIDERLRSRFDMSLTTDIQLPDVETRIAILYKKAEAEQVLLSSEVIAFVATHVKTNVRELEGALTRLCAYASLLGNIEVTIEATRQVLRGVIVEQAKQIRVDDIQKAVTKRFGIRISDLLSKRRTKHLVTPRHIAMYLCRELTGLSFPEIGRYFGNKDHATVIHACKQIEREKQENLATHATLQALIAEVKSET